MDEETYEDMRDPDLDKPFDDEEFEELEKRIHPKNRTMLRLYKSAKAYRELYKGMREEIRDLEFSSQDILGRFDYDEFEIGMND